MEKDIRKTKEEDARLFLNVSTTHLGFFYGYRSYTRFVAEVMLFIR